MTQTPTPETSLQTAEDTLRAAHQALDQAVATGSSADVLTARDALDRAQTDLDTLRTAALAAAADAYAATVSADLDQAQAGDDKPMLYNNTAEWLTGYLLPMWRCGPEARWCRKWWLHAEAYTRIEALWRAWEALRYEGPLGIATWLLNCADPLMRELTSPHRHVPQMPPPHRRTRRTPRMARRTTTRWHLQLNEAGHARNSVVGWNAAERRNREPDESHR